MVPDTRNGRAAWLASLGGLDEAIAGGHLSQPVTIPLTEALVLGLMRQGVTKYLMILGHGSTELAETLRIYEEAGLVRGYQFRNEVEMAHAGTALRWVYGETAAVVTSIGPGAFQAMAGSLAAASNGVGLYHIYGDETTRGEGYNMQQVPKPEQGLFGRITALMGASYTLHTPGALRDALRRGAATVFHPWKAGPFYLNLPLNTQPAMVAVRPDALPRRPRVLPQVPADDTLIEEAVGMIRNARRVAIKAGGGTRGASDALRRLAEAAGAAVVLSPGSTGVMPESHPLNMHVGGSKGSISGNFAMVNADLAIFAASRAVCQSDCSGIGWPGVRRVININADPVDVLHYNNTLALPGDAATVMDRLAERLGPAPGESAWLTACAEKKAEWRTYREERYACGPLLDSAWKQPVLTQPQAIRVADRFARHMDAIKFFDAGDVQANGFQVVEDEKVGESYTESGSSYMGFAVSALLAGGLADQGRYAIAITGDGSFMMNPQILVDGVEHGVHGTILILDNRRMGAISQLQVAQYGKDYRTADDVIVDLVGLATAVGGVKALHGGWNAESLRDALHEAHAWPGLSVIHVPVYYGSNPLGGLGAWGAWNVGNWCDDVEKTWTGTLI